MNSFCYDKVFKTLKEYVPQNSEYSPDVNKTNEGDIFPKVVVEENDNRLLSRDNMRVTSISSVDIVIDIYARSKTVGTTTYSRRAIAIEIRNLCDEVCSDIYGMKRTLCKPTPNVDSDIYRITMHFIANQNDMRNYLY